MKRHTRACVGQAEDEAALLISNDITSAVGGSRGVQYSGVLGKAMTNGGVEIGVSNS
jgi:hypothetical protein